MTPVALPATFPVGTLFAVIDGVPVTESPSGEMLRWDAAEPSPFAGHHAGMRTVPMSEATFRALVGAG